MIAIKTVNGDIVFENGDFKLVDGYDELAQAIWTVLSINKNEWFLNMNWGLDYSKISGKGKYKEDIIAAIEEAIYLVDRVKQVYIKDVEVTSERKLIVYGYVTDREENELDLTRLEVFI